MESETCLECGAAVTLCQQPRQAIIGPLTLVWWGWPKKYERLCEWCDTEEKGFDEHKDCYTADDLREAYEDGRDSVPELF